MVLMKSWDEQDKCRQMNFRATIFIFLISQLGAEGFEIWLTSPKYAQRDTSIVMKCDYNFPLENIYKIEFHRNERRIFQHIMKTNRSKIFDFEGGIIDSVKAQKQGKNAELKSMKLLKDKKDKRVFYFQMKESNEAQIKIVDLKYKASGNYSCSLSTEAPVNTKFSKMVVFTVYEPQKSDPRIFLRKAAYTVGELLQLNCSSGPARPAPAVSWLLNGEKVIYEKIRSHHHDSSNHHSHGDHLCTSTAQLTLSIAESHIGVLKLSCLSTIPGSLDDENEKFADYRVINISISVNNKPALPMAKSPGATSFSLSSAALVINSVFLSITYVK